MALPSAPGRGALSLPYVREMDAAPAPVTDDRRCEEAGKHAEDNEEEAEDEEEEDDKDLDEEERVEETDKGAFPVSPPGVLWLPGSVIFAQRP